MSDMMSIEIRKYDESLAEAIAQMWNTWDDLWPGGFTQGVPYTADRVKKQYGKMSAIALLVAVDKKTDKPVGSCTVHRHWRDTEAAYVGTLGVSPEALSKKVGKQLLLESVRIASAGGYTRVDLNTWPGNMRAVPLYKKVGMMWDPEGQGLSMYDYIPGILKHPLCAPFFNLLHGVHEWYDVHIRNPNQAPDDFKKHGMAIYPYEFRMGNSALSVTVDRYARGITAVERTLNGQKISVAALVDSQEVIYGLPYVYSLEIENLSGEHLTVSINLREFPGLQFDADTTRKTVVKPGEKSVWHVPFHLTSSAPLFRDNIKASSISAEIEMNGEISMLHTGLKVQSPAEIRTRWGECRIAAGGRSTIPVTVISNLNQEALANVSVRSSSGSVQIKVTPNDIVLKPKEQGGTILEISSSADLADGTHDIRLTLTLDIEKGIRVVTRDFRIPIFCLGKKDVAVGEDDRRLEAVIVSPHYTARFAREGAILTVQDANSETSQSITQSSEIGPPFGLSPFRFAERKLITSSSDSAMVVSMQARHLDKPLIVEDRAVFEFGTGVIKHEQWVENMSSENQTFQGRLVGRGGGISFAAGQVYVPFSSGVVSEPLGNTLFSFPAIPSEPKAYSEGWIAIENEDSVQAQMWCLDKVEEIRITLGQVNALGFPVVTLEPREKRKITDSWLVFGKRSWRDIQRLWRSRVAHYYEERLSASKEQAAQHLLTISSDPIVIPHAGEAHTKIHIHSPLHTPHGGVLEVTPPRGWKAFLKSHSHELDGLKTEINFAEDSSLELVLTPGPRIRDEFAVHKGQCNLRMEYDTAEPISIVQLGSSGKSVEVSKTEEQGCIVHRVRNASIEFAVSKDYGGCLFSLKNKRGVEFLTSSFPKATPRSGAFFENYHGGVQPIIFDDEMGESLTKARTNSEKMSAKNYSRGIWSGVEISWKGKIQQTTRGLQFNLRYLTAPACPIVVIEWQIVNRTTAPVRFYPSILIDPKLDEELSGGKIRAKWSGRMYDIRGGHVPMAVSPSDNLVWIKPEKSRRRTSGLCYMVNGTDADMLSVYLGDMLILTAVDSLSAIMPREERVMTSCLFVDPPDMETLEVIRRLLGSLLPKRD